MNLSSANAFVLADEYNRLITQYNESRQIMYGNNTETYPTIEEYEKEVFFINFHSPLNQTRDEFREDVADLASRIAEFAHLALTAEPDITLTKEQQNLADTCEDISITMKIYVQHMLTTDEGISEEESESDFSD